MHMCPKESRYSAIMESGPPKPYHKWFLSPNSKMALYLDPTGAISFLARSGPRGSAEEARTKHGTARGPETTTDTDYPRGSNQSAILELGLLKPCMYGIDFGRHSIMAL